MFQPKIQRLTIALLTAAISLVTLLPKQDLATANVTRPIAQKHTKAVNLPEISHKSIATLLALAKQKKKKKAAQNTSQISVIYRDTKSGDELAQVILESFRKEKLLEIFSQMITVQLKLPRKVTLIMEDCGSANAYYNQQNHSITICNELSSSLFKTFVKGGLTEEEAIEPVIYTIAFTFYHEAGHMLIHELNLPITGKEEDVADQFSAHVFLDWLNTDPETADFGQNIIKAAFLWFNSSEDNLGDLTTFMDEHSLNKQRALSLLCMLYVKNPDLYAKSVIQLGFEPNRLRKCRQESEQISGSWDALLAPHMKNQ
jgi:hypothetical protein